MNADENRSSRSSQFAFLKQFMVFFLPISLFTGIVLSLLFLSDYEKVKTILENDLKNHINLESDIIINCIKSVITDT